MVGGVAPRALPAGRLSGKAIRDGASPGPRAWHRPASRPAAVGPADCPIPRRPDRCADADLAAAVDPGGLKREVFGFLPYWELTDSSTRLDWEKLSTIAYFGVGAAGNGNLQKTNSDGSTTVGWSGWTSSKMTGVINAAHANGARVVLTVQSFAWSSARRRPARRRCSAARRTAPTSPARSRRPSATAAPTASTSTSSRSSRPTPTSSPRWSARSGPSSTRSRAGYQLTFDTTGWIGNYPIEAATASGGADAVVIMGYDYKNGSSSPVGSVAPLGGPGYDIGDTIRAYVAPRARPRRSSSACRTTAAPGRPAPSAARTPGTSRAPSTARRRPSSTAPPASTPSTTAGSRTRSRAWPGPPTGARTARRPTAASSPGAQLYYDDAKALGLKYDLVNRYNLRGAGIWALGYDGTRTELYSVAQGQVHHRHRPAGDQRGRRSAPRSSRPTATGGWTRSRVRLSVTGHIQFGWVVQPLDRRRSPGRRSGPGASSARPSPSPGTARPRPAQLVPDGTYRITRLDRRRLEQPGIGQQGRDRRPAARPDRRSPRRRATSRPTATATPTRRRCRGRADERITGTARLFDRTARPSGAGRSPRRPPDRGPGTAGTRPGRPSPTAATRSASIGLDRAGNQTIRDLHGPRRPDDPVADLGALVVHPASGPEGPLHARPAPAGDGHRRDLPGLDPGPPDLDGSGPGGRHLRLDLERQDGRRRVRQARDATGSSSTRRAASGRRASAAASPSGPRSPSASRLAPP